jgi:hypothetical protein
LQDIIPKAIIITFCLIWIYGHYRRWQWLVNPKGFPMGWSPQRIIRDAFGEKFLVWLNYFLGIIAIAALLFVF